MIFAPVLVLLYFFRSFIVNAGLFAGGMLLCTYSDNARHMTRVAVEMARPWVERARGYAERTLARAREAMAAHEVAVGRPGGGDDAAAGH